MNRPKARGEFKTLDALSDMFWLGRAAARIAENHLSDYFQAAAQDRAYTYIARRESPNYILK